MVHEQYIISIFSTLVLFDKFDCAHCYLKLHWDCMVHTAHLCSPQKKNPLPSPGQLLQYCKRHHEQIFFKNRHLNLKYEAVDFRVFMCVRESCRTFV